MRYSMHLIWLYELQIHHSFFFSIQQLPVQCNTKILILIISPAAHFHLLMLVLFCLFANWICVTSAGDLNVKLTFTWQLILLYSTPREKTLQEWHHTFIIHHQLHSSCPPVVQCCWYIIKVKVSFKQGFSLLFSLHPSPVSLHGHADWNVGTRVWYGGLGSGKQAGNNKWKGGFEAKMWMCDGTAESGLEDEEFSPSS